jgi:hypothetical protein
MITSSPSAENGKRRRKLNIPRYQWFWAANYRDISALTPDLTHTVKRHVIVKRVIPIHAFPVSRLESAREVLRATAWKEKAERSHAPEDQKAAYDSLNIRHDRIRRGRDSWPTGEVVTAGCHWNISLNLNFVYWYGNDIDLLP